MTILRKRKNFTLLFRKISKKPSSRNLKKTRDIQIRNKIVSHNLGLVLKAVNKYGWALSPTVDKMDLIQAGNEGLIKAVEDYDPEKGTRLSPYAFYRITRSIRSFLLEQAHIVRIKYSAENERAVFGLTGQKERFSLSNENFNAGLAAEDLSFGKVKVRPETVERMNIHLSYDTVSFNQPLGALEGEASYKTDLLNRDLNSEKINNFEEIHPAKAPFLQELVIAERGLEELKKMMRMFLSRLGERNRDVFIKRILMYPPVSIYKTAEIYGISGEWVRRVEAKLMREFHSFGVTEGFSEELFFSPLFSKRDRYQIVRFLSSWTESVYGMSFDEYIQADQVKNPRHSVPLSL